MITWSNFLSQLFNGLALGALLALISSGLTIIYGTLGVLNLAHGAMFMLGGYAGYVAYQATGSFVRRGDRRHAVHAGRRRGDGAGRHPPFLRPPARGPAAGHLRPVDRASSRSCASSSRASRKTVPRARRCCRASLAGLHVLSDLPARRGRHRARWRCWRSSSCSTARGWA